MPPRHGPTHERGQNGYHEGPLERIRSASGSAIPFQATFSRQELEQAARMPDPQDKWFVYLEEPHLFLGQPMYRVTLAAYADGASVAQALCVPEVLEESSVEYEAKLLDFLISNLLLGQAKSFPYPKRTHRMPQDAIEGGVARHALPNSIRSHGQRAPCERSE